MSDRRSTMEARSTGATFCFLVLTLFGSIGGTARPADGVVAAPRIGLHERASISTGVEEPRARALPASASFATAAQESQHGGASPRPASGSSRTLSLDAMDPPAPRDGLPPRASALALRSFVAHPSTAPPRNDTTAG